MQRSTVPESVKLSINHINKMFGAEYFLVRISVSIESRKRHPNSTRFRSGDGNE